MDDIFNIKVMYALALYNRTITIIIAFLILNCNSKTQNNKPKIEIVKETAKTEIKSPENITEEEKDSIIYDTLIFNEDMKGKTLIEKFKSSQNELVFYKNFINSKNINKLQTLNAKHTKTEIRYLGEIKDLNKINSYHVITNFEIIGIGQMLSPRGRSEFAFINENQDKIIIYHLPMPDDLPKLIKKNVLFFQFEKTKIGISISGGLPPLFCIPEIGCN